MKKSYSRDHPHMSAEPSNPAGVATVAPVLIENRGGVATMFRSFRSRDFTFYWTGNFLSNIGTWIQTIALGWVILVKTNSPFLLGLNGFLGQIPSLLFSLPGGAIADRLSRRRLMLWTQATMMLLALVLAVLTSLGRISVAEILVISFLSGTASTLNYPAYQATFADLVEREDLPNAIALNSAQFNLSRAIGPTLSGLALGTLGAAACFYLNSVSFLALIIALFVIVIPPRKLSVGSTFWSALGDGFRFLKQNQLLILLLTVPAFLSVVGLPFIVLMPVYARDLIGVGAPGLGYLMAGAGVGAVISALVLAARTQPGELRAELILTGAVIFSVALMLFSRAHNFWWAFALLVVLGATMVGSLTLTNTALQMSSPPELRGRVMSIYLLSLSGVMPLGSLLAGTIVQTAGPRFQLALAGTLCLIYFFTLLIFLPRLRRVAQSRRRKIPI